MRADQIADRVAHSEVSRMAAADDGDAYTGKLHRAGVDL